MSRFLRYSIFLLVFLLPTSAEAASDVFLSQIQTQGDDTDDEFVEIYNSSGSSVNLSGWSIRRKTKGDTTAKGTSLKTFGSGDSIPSHGYFLWSNTKGIFSALADTTTSSSLTDDNSLGFFDKNGNLVDSVTWGSGHTLPFSATVFPNPGKKERLLRGLSSLVWGISKTSQPTNSKGVSYEEPKPPEPVVVLPTGPFLIRINEVMPNPDTKSDVGEFIELYNFGDTDIDLSDWTLHDGSKTGKYTFPKDSKIEKEGYLVVTDEDFSFSINNTHETISLFDSLGNLVHEVSYEKTKEDISLGFVNGKLHGSNMPTPGAKNIDDQDPTTKEKVPKEGYKSFKVEFNARGKDKDGDKLKYTWDFGDDHKSYKEKTTHIYKKTGKYTVTLSTDDGKNVTEETFEIKISKYKYPDLKIVSFIPNPKGKDTESEWVEIENRSKKNINLKDFGIATGTKKLTNHPIKENLYIAKKSKRKVTRDEAKISLGNIKGKIELRAPDGHVIDKLKYSFPKSLAEDALLIKEKGKPLALVEPPKIPAVAEPPKEPALPPVTPDSSNDTSQPEEKVVDTPQKEVVTPIIETIPEPTKPLPVENKKEGFISETLSVIFNWLDSLNVGLNSLLARN